jgi:hypothetical protein
MKGPKRAREAGGQKVCWRYFDKKHCLYRAGALKRLSVSGGDKTNQMNKYDEQRSMLRMRTGL